MKKTTKVTKKTIKKEFKPAYVVDLTNVKTAEDMVVAFAEAKMSTVLTEYEIDTLYSRIVTETFEVMDSMANSVINVKKAVVDISNGSSLVINKDGIKIEEPKKPNIFKRFWNWLTRKNK